MPRSLINLIGALVTIGVLALAFFLVALPIMFQALGVFGQTVTVTSTNATYQTQVDQLREEEERLPEIEASVATLQTQITPANELDDVFDLVATEAESSGVSLISLTAGDASAFVERTAPTTPDEAAAPAVAAATPDPSATPPPVDGTAADAAPEATEASAAAAGRTQVDFTITVAADEFDQVVQFLDGLRAGPRLLQQIQTIVSPTGTGYDVTVTALTFVLPSEG